MPFFARMTLPPPFSSAGVPITTIFPFISDFANAIAAPIDAGPIRLCPQPCPTSGRASYSAIKQITGLLPFE